MNSKRKLKLNSLEGNVECFLEIQLLPSGDFYIGMKGQNIYGEVQSISAQISNPINAGGNLNDYETLKKIYEVMN